MAAILDLPVTPTSESIDSSFAMFDGRGQCGCSCWISVAGSCLRSLILSCMCFRYYIRHFDLRLNTVAVQPGINIVSSSGDFEALKNWRTNLVFFPIGEIRFFIRLKNVPTQLRLRCRHLMTGWTTSGISTSFYSY